MRGFLPGALAGAIAALLVAAAIPLETGGSIRFVVRTGQTTVVGPHSGDFGPATESLRIHPLSRRHPIPGMGAITGRVLDRAGRPVADVCVSPNNVVESGPSELTVRSRADGTYVISPIHTEYSTEIEFWHCSYPAELATRRILVLFESGRTDRIGNIRRLPVSGRTDVVRDVDVVLHAGGSISGTVVDDAGTPAVGATALVFDGKAYGEDDPSQRPLGTATTDASGRFRIGGLAEGTYWVAFEDCRGRYLSAPYGGEDEIDCATTFAPRHYTDVRDWTPIEVDRGEAVTGIDATLRRMGALSIHLYSSVEDALSPYEVLVSLRYADGSLLPLPMVGGEDASGSWFIEPLRRSLRARLEPGAYTVHLSCTKRCGEETVPVEIVPGWRTPLDVQLI